MTWEASGAGLDDADAVTRLHRRAAQAGFAHIFPPDAPPPRFEDDLDRWRFWLGPDREHGRHCFTVRTDGQILGVVLAGPDPDDRTLGHLARLYVGPDQWGRGIGNVLYRTAVEDLRASGFDTATLWVLEGNHRARRWYERLGWSPTSRRKPTYEPAGIFDTQYRLALNHDR